MVVCGCGVALSLSPSSSLAPPLSVSFSLCPLSTTELLLTPSFGTRTQSAINSQMLYRVGEELCGFGVFFSSSLHCFLLNEEVLWCGCPCCSLELWKQWGGCYIGSVGLWASAAVRCVLLVMVRVGLWAPEVHFSLLFVCSSSFRHIRLSCDLFSFFYLIDKAVLPSLCVRIVCNKNVIFAILLCLAPFSFFPGSICYCSPRLCWDLICGDVTMWGFVRDLSERNWNSFVWVLVSVCCSRVACLTLVYLELSPQLAQVSV